jgi:hypothetical protein
LFHASERDGRWHLVRETLDGTAEAEVLLTTDEELTPGAVSAGGESIFYVTRAANGRTALWVLDVGRRHSTRIEGVPERVAMPVLSPNGRWLGFTGWRTRRPSIFVRGTGRAAPVRELLEAAGYTVWNRTGDTIYFRSRVGASEVAPNDGVFEMPFDPVRGEPIGPAKELFRIAFMDFAGVPGFDVSSDGRFLLVLADERESLARDPQVILHLDDELRRRTSALAR